MVVIGAQALLDEFGQRDVTMEEYAAIMCDRPGLGSGATWSDARAYTKANLRDRKGLNPPEEMREWHEGMIEMTELILDALSGHDGDAAFNEMRLILNPDAHAAADVGDAAERSLSLETHRELRRLGCDI